MASDIEGSLFVEVDVSDEASAFAMANKTLERYGFTAPLAFAMGYCFPVGMRLTEHHSGELTPWMWGVNGACGVMASIVRDMRGADGGSGTIVA